MCSCASFPIQCWVIVSLFLRFSLYLFSLFVLPVFWPLFGLYKCSRAPGCTFRGFLGVVPVVTSHNRLTLENPWGHLWILLCLTPDDFTRQRGKCLGSPGLNLFFWFFSSSLNFLFFFQVFSVFFLSQFDFVPSLLLLVYPFADCIVLFYFFLEPVVLSY